jgi:hypothetical protein
MTRNTIARDLHSAKYHQRIVNGRAQRTWADLEEFELGARNAIHQAALDAIYHAERVERLAAYRTLRDGARR